MRSSPRISRNVSFIAKIVTTDNSNLSIIFVPLKAGFCCARVLKWFKPVLKDTPAVNVRLNFKVRGKKLPFSRSFIVWASAPPMFFPSIIICRKNLLEWMKRIPLYHFFFFFIKIVLIRGSRNKLFYRTSRQYSYFWSANIYLLFFLFFFYERLKRRKRNFDDHLRNISIEIMRKIFT